MRTACLALLFIPAALWANDPQTLPTPTPTPVSSESSGTLTLGQLVAYEQVRREAAPAVREARWYFTRMDQLVTDLQTTNQDIIFAVGNDNPDDDTVALYNAHCAFVELSTMLSQLDQMQAQLDALLMEAKPVVESLRTVTTPPEPNCP